MRLLKYYMAALCMASGLFLSSCNDDFMQQDPIQELAEGSFLKNEGDLPLYLNQLYDKYITGHQRGWAYDDVAPFGGDVKGSPIIYKDMFSDNAVRTGSIPSRLKETYIVPQGGSSEGWNWDNLKRVNYFLRNYRMAEGSVQKPEDLNKWAAEAYFFKAWDYYQKVVAFGEVPWFVTDLNVDSEELYAPRTPRAEVMDSIMKCINYAVTHIQDPEKANPNGRINKDMANFLKARIALFEGTYRKYHTELNLQATANDFLRECVTACEAILETGRYSLYNTGTDPYWTMFTFKNTPTADGNKEAILARVYDGSKIGHCTLRYYEQNNAGAAGRYSKGATRSLIDEYLCVDGRPIYTGGTEGAYEANPNFKGYDGLWSELDNRDPRLRQTVVRPGEFLSITQSGAGEMDVWKYGINYPAIGYNYHTPIGSTVTGYMFCKHWMCDRTEFDATTNGQQTGVMFRLGEVLLMLAEAKAELGEIDNAILDKTINALRLRAGFDFEAHPNSRLTMQNIPADPRLDKIYAEKLDYSVPPIIREIRRERRVEMAMEGLRYEDLMRWKAGKLFTVPLRGMKFTEEKQKMYDGTHATLPKEMPAPGTTPAWTAKKATVGTEVFLDEEGFIIPYPRDPNIRDGILPWNDKRYYWPIPYDQLTLNKNLTQSPGWDDIDR